VLWTRSGFYATNAPQKTRASATAVDRGPHREALVPARLTALPSSTARTSCAPSSSTAARSGRVRRASRSRRSTCALILPPVVEIERFTVAADRREVRLSASASSRCARHQPTTRGLDPAQRSLRLVRGRTPRRCAADAGAPVNVRLNPGRNVFRIHAEGASARSVPCVLEVEGAELHADANVQLEAGTGQALPAQRRACRTSRSPAPSRPAPPSR
ncbi:MAG: hypothetical protein MZW92_12845, partial [Comamonadaceae bacterium]|nr:hypothetical protein [Comamonadaceae bacterium]